MSEYKLVSDKYINGLTKQVNELLSDGWQLQGGVSVTIDHGGFQESALVGGGLIATRSALFVQAVVRQ